MANVIFLNGCSSAGKTTLAIKLQQMLDEPYQHIALDHFRDGMPMRLRGLNSPPGTPGSRGLNVVPIEKDGELVTSIQFGEYGEQVLKNMRRSIALFQQAGTNVIIDDLLFKRAYLDDYVSVLDPENTWFIGVKCSLEVVKARESKRPGRFPGTATSHFDQVHDHGEAYDLEVDTSESSARDVAQQIIDRLSEPPKAFQGIPATQS
jgi:chloramphenicol 3-O phosphotransferase